MKDHIFEKCSMEFDSPLLEEVNDTLQSGVIEWINMVYGTYTHTR